MPSWIFPSAQGDSDASDIALIKKVTGRIPLLPIEEQEALYSLIESEYRDLVDQAGPWAKASWRQISWIWMLAPGADGGGGR
jgi:hypothetical protein